MATKAAFATGDLPATVSSTVDLTSSGFGTVDAAILFSVVAQSGANPRDAAFGNVGFWDGTNQTSISIADGHNKSTATDAARAMSSNRIYYLTDSTGAKTGEATASAVTDGIRLTVNDAVGSLTPKLQALLINGITNAATGSITMGTVDQAVTVGFEPDVVFLLSGNSSSAIPYDEVHNRFIMGVSHRNGSSVYSHACLETTSEDGTGDTDSHSEFSNTLAFTATWNGTEQWTAVCNNFTSTAFTVDIQSGGTNANNRKLIYLALELADPDDFEMDVIDTQTSGTSWSHNGFSFAGDVIGLIGSGHTALDTLSETIGIACTFGLGDGTTEHSMGWCVEQGPTVTDTSSWYDASNILNQPFDSQTDDAIASLTSIDNDGFTLNYSDTATTATKLIAFTFGDSTAATYTLTAEAGSYTYTGAAAGLAFNRRLNAEAGAYTFTGAAADLTISRKLTAEAGSYTFTGADAGLTIARNLVAEAGSYAFTGADATLTYTPSGVTYTLVADAGSYSFTGADAALTISRNLVAEAGSYTFTGADATLSRGFNLQAEAAAYTFTGADAAFVRSYALQAEAGSYTFTGGAVTFDWSGVQVWTPISETSTTWTEIADASTTWTEV